MNYKTIGNTLTPSEFNAIQYLLNKNMSRTITVPVTETITTDYVTIKTTFGTKYYKRKNGFITNSLKMKVIDPLFENMDYTIQLRYKTLNNDLLDNDDDEETTITYHLPVNTEVTITEATLDHIIENNAELTIDFNKPLIQKAKSIILNGTEFWIENEETLNVTATILANTTPIPSAKVSFSTEGTSTTETTNNQGIATYTYTGEKAGKLNYTVTYEGLTTQFTIYDSFFHNDTFFNASNRITKTTNPDNTITLKNNATANGFYLADLTGTATSLSQCLQFDAPFTILYEITDYTGVGYIQLYDGTTTKQLKLRTFELPGKAFTVRVDIYEDRVEYYVNGTLREDLTWTGTLGTCRAGIRLDAGATVTYKNIYLSDITATPITPVDTVSLSASPASITIGGSTSLTATVTLEDETPAVGRSVSFFDGETLLGSSVTDSNGVASYTYAPLSVGSCTLTAQCGGVESSSVTVTVNKITSTISLTGSNVTYPSNVSLSGSLSAGSGKSVKIYQDNVLIDTVTTGTGGAYTKTVTGLNAGSYTFKAVFDGDSQYSSVTSSDKSITVSKATPTISLATSSDTVDVGETFTLSGTLSVGTGQSVKVYQGDTLVDTVTTSTGGAYSKSITPSTAGTYTYKTVFEATTNYNSVTSSTVTVSVGDAPTPVPTSITLSADKSILSYADTESAVLSATVKDQDSQVMEGVTVEFFNGSTSMGTATTNSSGIATKTYASAGAGDVSFTAGVGSLVSETYSIEDCKYYSTTEYKQNTDGITLDISLPSTFKLEFDIKPTSRSTSGYGSGCYLRIGTTSSTGVWAGQLTSAGKHGLMPKPSGTTQYCTSYTVLSTDNHITIVFDGSTASYTCNDESVSLSASSLTKINGVVPTANNGLKNIKIKPL